MKCFLLVLVAVSALALPSIDAKPYELPNEIKDIDNFSLDEIKKMLGCICDKTPCSNLGATIRQYYPEVLVHACDRCSEEQKRIGARFYARVMKELPEEMDEFKRKFDPDNKYFDNFYAVLDQSLN